MIDFSSNTPIKLSETNSNVRSSVILEQVMWRYIRQYNYSILFRIFKCK